MLHTVNTRSMKIEMKGVDYTKEQLFKEIDRLNSKIGEFEKSETLHLQSKEELKANHEKLRLMIDNSPIGFCATDLEGKFIEVNPAYCKMLGYSKNELLYNHFTKFSHPDDKEKNDKLYKKLVTSRITSFDLEKRYIHKNGKVIYVIMRSQLVHNNEEKPIFEIAIVEDITERKLAEKALLKSETKYRDLFEKSKDAILILKNGKFVDCNNAAYKMLLFNSKEELLNTHPSDISPEKQPDGQKSITKANDIMRMAFEKGSYRFEWDHIKTNGEICPVEVLLTNVSSDKKTKILHTTWRDISKRRQSEKIQSVLYNISNAANSTKNLDELYKIIHQQLGHVINDENFYIANYNEETDEIFTPFFITNKVNVTKPHKMRKKGVTNYIIKSGKSIFLTEKLRKKLIDKGEIANYKWSSKTLLGVPLKIGTKVVGCLVVRSSKKETFYSKKDLSILEFISGQIAIAIARKKSEEALSESESVLRSLFNAMSDVIVEIDKNGKYLYVAPTSHELLYKPATEIIGKTLKEVFPKQKADEFLSVIRTALKEKRTVNIQYSLKIGKNEIWFDASITPKTKNTVIFVARDITELKQSENDIKESEIRYHLLFDSASDAIFLMNDNMFIDCNEKTLEMFACKRDEIVGHSPVDFSPKYQPKWGKSSMKAMENINAALGGNPQFFEWVHKKLDGTLFDAEVGLNLIELPSGNFIQAIVRDITERKKVEESIRISEEKYRTLSENLNVGVYRLSPGKDGTYVEVNPAFMKIFGYKNKEEVLQLKVTDFYFNKADRKDFVAEMSANSFVSNKELLLKKKDGTPIYCSISSVAVIENNKIKFHDGTIEDISKRKLAARALIESEQLSSAVIEDSPLGISVRDRFGTLILYNKAWKKIWGFTEEQIKSDEVKRTKLQMSEKDSYLGKHLEKVRKIYTKGGTYHIPELELLPGGNKKASCIMQRFYAIKNEDDEVEKVVILTSDISEWKQSVVVQGVLYNITHQVNRASNLDELYEVTQRELSKIINTQNFFIANSYGDSDQIHVAYSRDEMDGDEDGIFYGKTLSSYVMKTGKPLLAPADKIADMYAKGIIDDVGTDCKIWLGVPLVLGDKTVGVIVVQSYTNPDMYTEREMEILSFVSNEIALAIDNKQVEEQIKVNLEEKNTLLRELYHRTKNNMQVISSMLKLQSRNLDSRSMEGNIDLDYVHTSFNDVVNKIKAMSLVHQKLYQSKDLSRINLKEYIKDIVNLLMVSYGVQAETITLKMDLKDVFVLIDSAIPLGLVLNEMISNIFKHAFQDTKDNEISIRLYQEENDTINILLGDNGIGIPEDIDLASINTMGLQTMFDLIKFQLKGKVRYDSENGLKWHIKLKDNLHKERI